jgi:hypothetical protein
MIFIAFVVHIDVDMGECGAVSAPSTSQPEKENLLKVDNTKIFCDLKVT